MNFLNFYKHPKNIRYNSFEFALTEAKTRCHRVVVETGVARGKIKFFFFSKINWKDGMSTMILSDYAKYMSGELHSCDISSLNVKNAIKFTSVNKNFINFYVDDSLNFLSNFSKTIDFLYLDSLDGQFPNACEHQLKEIMIAKDKLKNGSLVLLDDKVAKTNLSIDYMIKNNFKIINETNEQVLLSYEI